MSDCRAEIAFLGVESAPSFVRQPSGYSQTRDAYHSVAPSFGRVGGSNASTRSSFAHHNFLVPTLEQEPN
jgi:hypothetical protein